MKSKPVVVVSKCISFSPVRWDGSMVASEFVEKLKPYVDFVPVCPEMEIGLGVPRSPVRIVSVKGTNRLIQPATGLDFTEQMQAFSEKFISNIGAVDGFILKSGSPSSGFTNVKVYPSAERSASISRSPGFFGKAILEKYPHSAIEDERRLLNPRIKEHFLTKLYALAYFRETKNQHSINALVKYQSENKYLLTAYNQKQLHILGKIVGNQEKTAIDEILAQYETQLNAAFMRPPSVGSNINVMQKIMGYFTKQLTKEEKNFFQKSIGLFKEGKLPLSACKSLLHSWVIRFKEEYLSTQTFFEPYPDGLSDLDSYSAEFMAKEYWK